MIRFFPSLKYLCLLQAIRRADDKQFRMLYEVAVNDPKVQHDVNISWLLHESRFMTKEVSPITCNLSFNLYFQLRSGDQISVLIPLVSSGCAFAGEACFFLLDTLMDQQNRHQLYEWLMRDRSPYMIERLLSKGLYEYLSESAMALARMRCRNICLYLRENSSSEREVGFYNGLLDNRFSENRSHCYIFHMGLALKCYVGRDSVYPVDYFIQVKKNGQQAIVTWLLVAKRLRIHKDIRRYIARMLFATIPYDEAWGQSRIHKRIKQ